MNLRKTISIGLGLCVYSLGLGMGNLFADATAPVAAAPELAVIKRSAWSFDRSEIKWYDPAKVEDKKRQGIISEMCGWAEYDIEIPADGWRELVLTGGVAGWSRDIYVDGQRVVTLGIAGKDDMLDKNSYKDINLFLTKGKHAIKIRRLDFPGILPSAFELRPADGRVEGCISARIEGQSILRVGESLKLAVTGGTTVPTEYEIVAIGTITPSESMVWKVSFPATAQAITKTMSIPCTTEGVFELRAKSQGRLLRPNDFKGGTFAVIDTRRAAPAPKTLNKTLIHDIDCVKQTDLGKPIATGEGFWEATEPTRIAKTEAGEYREGGDGTDPNLPFPPGSPSYRKYNSGFSYAIDVPKAQELYLLEVDYPDDDRRTVNVFVAEPFLNPQGMPCQLYGGYECGDWFELSRKMQTEQVLFWARGETVRAAILSKNPGMRAAAAKIRVYRIDGGLTEGGAPTDGGRLMVHWMEEPTRWLQHAVPPADLTPMGKDFVAIDRYLALCRYHGFNAVAPTEAIYQGATFHTDELEGWFLQPYDAARMVALLCEKHGMKYIPEIHLSGQAWFNQQVVEKLIPNSDDLYIYSRLGTSAKGGGSWFAAPWNPLHPAIQEKYIRIVGALADKVADSPAFAGVSCRLMSWVWQGWNGLPSLNWGYGDWDIAQFQKDTGVKVPGEATDPDRFQKRFEFLTAPAMLDRWVGWRNGRMLDYYQRIRNRIQAANPEAVLYFPYHGDAKSGMDLTFGSFFQTEAGALKEVGLDLGVLAKTPGISVLPSGAYGRRDLGNVVADAAIADSVADPERKQLGFSYERAFGFGNAYFEDQAQVPLHQLGIAGWDPAKRGGNNGAAEGAGRHVLEKLAYALADQDSSTLLQGGMGYTFGRPAEYNEFLAEYERLPKMPFHAFGPAQDPVAVWSAVVDHTSRSGNPQPAEKTTTKFAEGLYFYAVNREPFSIDFKLRLTGTDSVVQLVDGKPVGLRAGWLELTLLPYQIKAYRTDGKAQLSAAEAIMPTERIALIRDRLAFCQDLATDITRGSRKDDLSAAMRTAFMDKLDIAWQAAGQEHWWRARTVLSSAPMIAVFNALAQWPEDQLHRRMGLGLLTEARSGTAPATMLDAEKLMAMLAPGSDATSVAATTYTPDWRFAKVIKTEAGAVEFNLDIPVTGRYQLSLGHVAGDFGAMTVSLGGKNMPTLAMTTTPGQPEKTVFPAITLPAGKVKLAIKGQASFGIYGVILQPLYRPLPAPLWTTIGPFPTQWYSGAPGSLVKAAMERIDPPMQEVKTEMQYDIDGTKLVWTRSDLIIGGVPHFDELAGVSFLFRNKVQERGVCYAVTYITSPDDREAEILIGCDWWANVWMNGVQLKSARPGTQVMDDGCYFNGWRPLAAKVQLKKGVNTLLVKSHGGTVANWFTCHLTDPGDLTVGNTMK